jgi:hypothetical protein
VDAKTNPSLQALSRVICAMASGVAFVNDNPLSNVNPFIRDSKPIVDRFFEALIDQPSDCNDCLKNRKKRAKFREFLVKNRAEENLSFWVAVEQFKTIDTVEERRQQYVSHQPIGIVQSTYLLSIVSLSLSLSLCVRVCAAAAAAAAAAV